MEALTRNKLKDTDFLDECVGQGIQDWTEQNFCFSKPFHFKFFKDCLPQILLGPFLNTLTDRVSNKSDLLNVESVVINQINLTDGNCFCRMVGQRNAFRFISSGDHFQRFSPLQISDTL